MFLVKVFTEGKKVVGKAFLSVGLRPTTPQALDYTGLFLFP
jgi:hypothetical protein